MTARFAQDLPAKVGYRPGSLGFRWVAYKPGFYWAINPSWLFPASPGAAPGTYGTTAGPA